MNKISAYLRFTVKHSVFSARLTADIQLIFWPNLHSMQEEHICFFDQNFLAQRPLDISSILDYFSCSQFYDRSCLNAVFRMQGQFAGIDLSARLEVTPGVLYTAEERQPGLFVIFKKENVGVSGRIDAVRTLRVYYCIHGHIYCAPTEGVLSASRDVEGLWALSEALDQYEQKRALDWVGFCSGEEQQDESSEKFVLEVLREFNAGR